MPGVNFGTSVIKRDERPVGEVADKFKDDGWEQTASILGGRVRYLQKSGINLTAVGGPAGTVVFPSGPIRGRLFGNGAVTANKISSIGAGKKQSGEGSDRRTINTDQLV